MNNSLITPWKVLQSKIIHSTQWIEIIADTCLNQGKELIYTYTRRIDEGPLIIAEESDGKIWLVRQYRHPIKKILWQLPVEGKLPQESWEAAARRGLHEELHLEAQTLLDIGTFYPDPGGLDQKYHLFIAKNLLDLGNTPTHQEDHENLEKKAFSWEEIDSLIKEGEIADNWTLAAFYLYRRHYEHV